MLEGLDQIDWVNVAVHVYGSRPQSEIPDAIREIMSDDERTREEALNFLFGQGQEAHTIWEKQPLLLSIRLAIQRHRFNCQCSHGRN